MRVPSRFRRLVHLRRDVEQIVGSGQQRYQALGGQCHLAPVDLELHRQVVRSHYYLEVHPNVQPSIFALFSD